MARSLVLRIPQHHSISLPLKSFSSVAKGFFGHFLGHELSLTILKTFGAARSIDILVGFRRPGVGLRLINTLLQAIYLLRQLVFSENQCLGLLGLRWKAILGAYRARVVIVIIPASIIIVHQVD